MSPVVTIILMLISTGTLVKFLDWWSSHQKQAQANRVTDQQASSSFRDGLLTEIIRLGKQLETKEAEIDALQRENQECEKKFSALNKSHLILEAENKIIFGRCEQLEMEIGELRNAPKNFPDNDPMDDSTSIRRRKDVDQTGRTPDLIPPKKPVD